MVVLSHAIPRFIRGLSANVVTTTGLALGGLVAWADYAAGPDISLVFFFLVPIGFVAWYAGALRGVLVALVCGFFWYGLKALLDMNLPSPLLSFIDLASHLGFFLIVAFLLARQRTLLDRERHASRTDFLTGALNRRAFIELSSTEIERARRHDRPFTVAYFDLDNFKTVNDQHGHTTGDAVLCRIVCIARQNLRATDSIARLGGDEFAFLLPETDAPAAQSVVEKIFRLVQDEMTAQDWPITLSVGVLTCERPPLSVETILRAADQLMYRVKMSGKNAILYAPCDLPVHAPHRAA